MCFSLLRIIHIVAVVSHSNMLAMYAIFIYHCSNCYRKTA